MFQDSQKSKIKLLLIEDNIKDATLFNEIIEECVDFDVELDHLNRLNTAMMLLEDKNYDLLVLDLTLPDSIGVETFRAIRNKFPNLPILVLTGTTLKRDELKNCLDFADGYLVKGYIDCESITKILNEITEKKELYLKASKI